MRYFPTQVEKLMGEKSVNQKTAKMAYSLSEHFNNGVSNDIIDRILPVTYVWYFSEYF